MGKGGIRTILDAGYLTSSNYPLLLPIFSFPHTLPPLKATLYLQGTGSKTKDQLFHYDKPRLFRLRPVHKTTELLQRLLGGSESFIVPQTLHTSGVSDCGVGNKVLECLTCSAIHVTRIFSKVGTRTSAFGLNRPEFFGDYG